MANSILEELYDIRREILSEHADDLAEYLRAGLAKTKAAGHPVAKITQRTIRCTGAARAGDLALDNQSSPPGDR
jgi:hypothetical protein